MSKEKPVFERTHPWLRFHLDTQVFSHRIWLLLGEAQSKCEHIAGTPLRTDVARDLHSLYVAKGAFATTSIEGNTLTEEQVRKRMEGQLSVPVSKEYLAREVDNMLRAFEDIIARCEKGRPLLNPDLVCGFNQQILDGLPLEEDVLPGKMRRHSVIVMDYRGAPAAECPMLLGRMCHWLEQNEMRGPQDSRIAFALLSAIMAHLYIAWIHPFGDGNGRTARLVESLLLLRAGVPTPAIHLLSNHYNETRSEYYRQLSHASKSGGEVKRFVEYAVRGFVDGLREQLATIREQQWQIAWRDFVFRRFESIRGAATERKLALALALPTEQGVEALGAAILTPRLASMYRGKNEMAIRRDLADLVEMQVARRERDHYRANRDIILQFLPFCGPDERTEIEKRGGEENEGEEAETN